MQTPTVPPEATATTDAMLIIYPFFFGALFAVRSQERSHQPTGLTGSPRAPAWLR